MADDRDDLLVDELLRDGGALLRIGLIVLGDELEPEHLAVDHHLLRVDVVDGEAHPVLVVLAEMGDRAGGRRHAADLHDEFGGRGRGRRRGGLGRRRRRRLGLVLAAARHGERHRGEQREWFQHGLHGCLLKQLRIRTRPACRARALEEGIRKRGAVATLRSFPVGQGGVKSRAIIGMPGFPVKRNRWPRRGEPAARSASGADYGRICRVLPAVVAERRPPPARKRKSRRAAGFSGAEARYLSARMYLTISAMASSGTCGLGGIGT